MTAASAADYQLVRDLRAQSIFKDLVPDLMPAQNGTIVVPCADGERITNLLTQHWAICGSGRNCHHTISLNGGPLLLPKGSPVAHLGERRVLLEHAYGGHRLKAVTTIVLYGHWPCGAALGAGLSLQEALAYCVEAKDVIRTFFRKRGLEPDVILCFHVDYANGRQRSYYFDRRLWEAWVAEQQNAA